MKTQLPKILTDALEDRGHTVTGHQNGYYTVVTERKLKFTELAQLAECSVWPLSDVVRVLNTRDIYAVIGTNEFSRAEAINELLDFMDQKRNACANILDMGTHLLIWHISTEQ